MSSIKKNFLYSSILTTAGVIFPILTYPYVSRVLGVGTLGLCNFIDSIINYFILFTTLGLSVTGIREIAKNRKNRVQLSQTFSNLVSLSMSVTAIASVILVILTFTISQLYENRVLMFYGLLRLIFNSLLIEWFYKGIEDFKYITIRSLLVKCLYVIAIFVFVKQQSDYRVYFLICTLLIVFNAIVNIIHSRRFIKFSFKGITFKPYLKSFFTIGAYNIMVSLYTTFNVAYLGFISGDVQVGYYTTATKLFGIILAINTAFTGVMIPRMSKLVSENKLEEFNQKLQLSVELLISYAFPIIVLTVIYSPEIIQLVSGPGYEGAITPMRIIMPLVFIVGYNQMLIIQALMPLNLDAAIFRNSLCAAVVGIILNILLVSSMACIGSAIVWICSEIVLMTTSVLTLKKIFPECFPRRKIFNNILIMLPLTIILCFTQNIELNYILKIIISVSITLVYCYILYFHILKKGIIYDVISKKLKK